MNGSFGFPTSRVCVILWKSSVGGLPSVLFVWGGEAGGPGRQVPVFVHFFYRGMGWGRCTTVGV